MYDISVPQEELEVAAGIEQQWMDLAVEARHVDKSLITVKKKFTLVCVVSRSHTSLSFSCSHG